MRFDEIHWVDINAPVKKEYTFKELNTESSKDVSKETKRAKEKMHFLERTLYDFITKKYKGLFTEATQKKPTEPGKKTGFSDEEWSSFKQSNQWQTFKK